MIAEFIITFREALEAALVVGIILAYLDRTGNVKYNKHVYLGVASGIIASIIVGVVFQAFSVNLESIGLKEEIFGGIVTLVAALMITWMILWMLNQKHLRRQIEKRVKVEVGERRALGLVLFTFTSVLREGFETVIFLSATVLSSGNISVIGALGGIIAAIILAFILFETVMRVNIKLFFNVTSMLLILFAAGLTVHAIYEFQKGGLLPQQNQLWNTKNILDSNSSIGGIAHALFGYTDNPTLLELLAWAGYLLIVAVLYTNVEKLRDLM